MLINLKNSENNKKGNALTTNSPKFYNITMDEYLLEAHEELKRLEHIIYVYSLYNGYALT